MDQECERSSLPPPRKRQRQTCPNCAVSLSKSSFYEHVSQCCPGNLSGAGPSRDLDSLSDSSFELDEGESEALFHSELNIVS